MVKLKRALYLYRTKKSDWSELKLGVPKVSTGRSTEITQWR